MTARQAFNLIRSEIVTVVPNDVAVGMGWPTETQLHNLGRGDLPPLISIYDRNPSRSVTRWNPEKISEVIVSTNLTSVLSKSQLSPGGVGTFTLGGTIALNDAVSLVAVNGLDTEGEVAVALSNSTLDSLTSSLAGKLSANPVFSRWFDIFHIGHVITLTNLTNRPIKLSSLTCNIAQATYEARRFVRHIQIVIWTNTEQLRDSISDPVVSLMAKATANYGFVDPDTGQFLRTMLIGDVFTDDPVTKDLYVRNILMTMEYGETYVDNLYPVLVARATRQIL